MTNWADAQPALLLLACFWLENAPKGRGKRRVAPHPPQRGTRPSRAGSDGATRGEGEASGQGERGGTPRAPETTAPAPRSASSATMEAGAERGAQDGAGEAASRAATRSAATRSAAKPPSPAERPRGRGRAQSARGSHRRRAPTPRAKRVGRGARRTPPRTRR